VLKKKENIFREYFDGFLRRKLNVYPNTQKTGSASHKWNIWEEKRVSRMNTKIVLPEINAKRPNMEVQDKKKESQRNVDFVSSEKLFLSKS